MDVKKFRKLFLDESYVHLSAMDVEIVQLEKTSSKEAVDSLFRHAHSLKGMAASMGYQSVVEVSHALEDLMSDVRDAGTAVSKLVIDHLLAGRDAIAEAVESISRDEEPPNITAVVARLRGAGMATGRGKVSTQVAPIARADDFDTEHAANIIASDAIWFEIRFSSLASLPAARAFQASKLLEKEALLFDPPIADVRAGRFQGVLRVSLAAALPPGVIAQIRSIPDVEKADYVGSWAAAVTDAPGNASKNRLDMPSQIRIDTSVLDRFVDMVGELLTVNNQIRETSRSLFSEELQGSVAALGRITGDLYQEVLQARMVPFSMLAERLPRVTRDLSQQLGKEVKLHIEGNDVEIDRSVMENLSDPLLHLVRNAIDHGLESPEQRRLAGKPAAGQLWVRAKQSESYVVIEIEEDGAGIVKQKVLDRAVERGFLKAADKGLSDQEVYDFLFRTGFSTAATVSNVSCRGFGLDVVKTALETLGGEIQIRSTEGQGTTFILRLPARVAIIPVFLVRAGEQTFALPIAKVSRARWIQRNDIQRIGGRHSVLTEGNAIPFYNFANLLGIQESFDETDELVVFEYERGTSRMLLGIDGFLEERDVYLKTAPRPLERLRGLLGITLVRGEPVFVLDPAIMVWTHA